MAENILSMSDYVITGNNVDKRAEEAAKAGERSKLQNLANTKVLLEQIVGFKESVYYDEDSGTIGFSKNVTLGYDNSARIDRNTKKFTDTNTEKSYKEGLKKNFLILPAGELTDIKHVNVLLMFLSQHGFLISDKILGQAIGQLALNNIKRANLEAIKSMINNGTYDAEIYKKVMVDWLGCKDEEYTYFWVKSLLAAVYQNQTYNGSLSGYNPVPNRYTMFGLQGIGKSMFFNGISDSKTYEPDTSNKFKGLQSPDCLSNIVSNIFVNLDDSAYGKSQKGTDEVKSMITRQTFKFRSPYAKNAATYLNRAVWTGSTNRVYAYSDTTGDRREYPIETGVGMDKKQARQHGSEIFAKYFAKDKTHDLINNLWKTWYEDNKKSKIEPVAQPDTDVDNARSRYVQQHMKPNDWQDTIKNILEMKVPYDIFKQPTQQFHKIKKSDIIEYIVAVYEDGVPSGLNSVRMYCNQYQQQQISDFDKIPATVINKSVSSLLGRGERSSYTDVIASLMYEEGYELKRSRTYVKIK